MDTFDKEQNINYFPGHMAKALKRVKETVQACDAAVLVLDARAPLASFPAGLDKLTEGKARAVVLSKPDLADPIKTKMFLDWFGSQGYLTYACDLKNSHAADGVKKALGDIRTNKDNRFLKLGFPLPPVKCLILGIPNVGKSTLINVLGGKVRAATENIPGKTRKTTMFRATERLWLFDTPGILEPRIHDRDAMVKLALLGSVKDDILPHRQLALMLLDKLRDLYPSSFKGRYGIEQSSDSQNDLVNLATARKFILPGGNLDLDRAERTVLTEFKEGKLGRLTIDEIPAKA